MSIPKRIYRMEDFAKGDRVRILFPGSVMDGEVGTVTAMEDLDDGLIHVRFDADKGFGWLDSAEMEPLVEPRPDAIEEARTR